MSRLVVIEDEERVVVAWEEDPDDWLCSFAKVPGFPARRWADEMARTYNARLNCASSPRRRAASGP